MSSEGEIPDPSEPIEEKLLFLQENMSNFVKQYNLPLIESALVVSKYLNILLSELEKIALAEGEILPNNITEPWPIVSDMEPPRIDKFPLERLMKTIDQDRMDYIEKIGLVEGFTKQGYMNTFEDPFESSKKLIDDLNTEGDTGTVLNDEQQRELEEFRKGNSFN
jgi:hypothetical protein